MLDLPCNTFDASECQYSTVIVKECHWLVYALQAEFRHEQSTMHAVRHRKQMLQAGHPDRIQRGTWAAAEAADLRAELDRATAEVIEWRDESQSGHL